MLTGYCYVDASETIVHETEQRSSAASELRQRIVTKKARVGVLAWAM
jgi:hypothetical protein